ncbi:5'-nucleotidase [Flavobacterium adhaerens]|uniref:5'-nucleotidase n=1 Tax=Flavobacterium adhaerens TaxID=3149043 RepID=UPI0032B369DC
MANLKNYIVLLKLFVTILTMFFCISCNSKKYTITKIEGKNTLIAENQIQNSEIDNFIKPYREKINSELDKILAYNPESLDKSKGEWQTNIGNFLADITLAKGNPVLNKRLNKNIDICLLNHGGIRSILPKGNVSSRNAFEIMPFENSLVVVALKGEQIQEMANFIITDKKPHPISGMTFVISTNNSAKNILIQGKPLEYNNTYYVATNDYLANGGDKMDFFKKGNQRIDLDYKLRNILIDYLVDVDTVQIKNDIRIIKE